MRPYDPGTGAGDNVAALPESIYGSRVAASGNAIYVLQGFLPSGYLSSWLARLSLVDGRWRYEDLSNTMPSFGQNSFFLDSMEVASVQDGVALLGFPEAGRDTALLKNEETSCTRYDKSLSTERVYNTTAVAHDGYLYALGYSAYEGDGMVFRATKIPTGEGEGGGDVVPSGGGDNARNDDAAKYNAVPLASTGDASTLALLALSAAALTAGALACGARLQARRDRR